MGAWPQSIIRSIVYAKVQILVTFMLNATAMRNVSTMHGCILAARVASRINRGNIWIVSKNGTVRTVKSELNRKSKMKNSHREKEGSS